MSIVNFRLCARFKYVSNSYYPVSNRSLDHCFHSFRSLFESISIDYKALELNYLQLSAAFFGIGELPSRALWFTLPDPIIITMNLRQYSTQSINATLSSPFSFRPENWIKVQKRQAWYKNNTHKNKNKSRLRSYQILVILHRLRLNCEHMFS